MRDIKDLRSVVLRLKKEKFSEANVVFLAGSVVRGESTEFSDLDLVVVYENVEAPRRESFVFEEWPVETFVHDLSTLEYYFKEDNGKSGIPSLMQMVSEGIAFSTDEKLVSKIKEMANSYLAKGPHKWTQEELDHQRYFITDLVDDLRAPRCREEMFAIGTRLFEPLTNFYFRSRGEWSALGKNMVRKLEHHKDEPLALDLLRAFDNLFAGSDNDSLIKVAGEILKP